MDIEEVKFKGKSSLLKTCIIFIVSMIVVFVLARYVSNDDFRSDINKNILKSEVSESSLKSIDIDNNSNVNIYAYDKYIAVLSKNSLSQYNGNGELIARAEINISVPLMDSAGKYMVLAENSGKKIYLISGKDIVWERDLEGEISRVSVNEKGKLALAFTFSFTSTLGLFSVVFGCFGLFWVELGCFGLFWVVFCAF